MTHRAALSPATSASHAHVLLVSRACARPHSVFRARPARLRRYRDLPRSASRAALDVSRAPPPRPVRTGALDGVPTESSQRHAGAGDMRSPVIQTVRKSKQYDFYGGAVAGQRTIETANFQKRRPARMEGVQSLQSPMKPRRAKRVGSQLSMASGTGSVISAMSSSQLRLLQAQQRERDTTVLLKQKELRLLKKMVTVGLGESEVPAYVPVEQEATYEMPPFKTLLFFAVILAPFVWAPRLFISHGLYAAVVPIFVSLALLLPYCRRALHEQRDLSRRFDHHLHEEENRARVARGESPLGSPGRKRGGHSPLYANSDLNSKQASPIARAKALAAKGGAKGSPVRGGVEAAFRVSRPRGREGSPERVGGGSPVTGSPSRRVGVGPAGTDSPARKGAGGKGAGLGEEL